MAYALMVGSLWGTCTPNDAGVWKIGASLFEGVVAANQRRWHTRGLSERDMCSSGGVHVSQISGPNGDEGQAASPFASCLRQQRDKQ